MHVCDWAFRDHIVLLVLLTLLQTGYLSADPGRTRLDPQFLREFSWRLHVMLGATVVTHGKTGTTGSCRRQIGRRRALMLNALPPRAR